MGKSSEGRSGKRRFGGGKGGGSARPAPPRRGPPALFVTCESGREKKCLREALDLIHHYYYGSRRSPSRGGGRGEDVLSSAKAEPSVDRPLSLEEELALLRKGAAAEEVLSPEPNSKRPRIDSGDASSQHQRSLKSPFSVYDTGVRGMVCILCTLPGSEMVPYGDILAEIRASKENGSVGAASTTGKNDPNNKKCEGIDGTDHNQRSISIEGKESKAEKGNDDVSDVLWDPVETVKCIMRDVTFANKSNSEPSKEDAEVMSKSTDATSTPPGSRFIARILPMQATCYASVEEIKAVSMSLLKRFVPHYLRTTLSKTGEEVSFKLDIKRRLCSHLKRDEVIESVTPLVLKGLKEMPGFNISVAKVNLSDPDFAIRIETCKALCGISILPRQAWYKNFNLAELNNPSSENDNETKQ